MTFPLTGSTDSAVALNSHQALPHRSLHLHLKIDPFLRVLATITVLSPSAVLSGASELCRHFPLGVPPCGNQRDGCAV